MPVNRSYFTFQMARKLNCCFYVLRTAYRLLISCIRVCGSEKFRKQNGRQIPADTWGSSYISVLTESLKNQYYEMIRKKQLITKIKSVDLFQLSVDSLQQISDVIQNSMTDENT